MLDHNQMVKVSEDAKFHAGKIAYFQFFGEGKSKDVAVLSLEPVKKLIGGFRKSVLISVDRNLVLGVKP